VCRVDVTGRPSDGAMTVNVIARRSVPGGVVPVVEIHHVSLRNPGFSASQKKAAATHHDVAASAPPR
jgi:hypothetical protein